MSCDNWDQMWPGCFGKKSTFPKALPAVRQDFKSSMSMIKLARTILQSETQQRYFCWWQGKGSTTKVNSTKIDFTQFPKFVNCLHVFVPYIAMTYFLLRFNAAKCNA